MTTALEDAVGRLVNHVQHWTPNRWERSSSDGCAGAAGSSSPAGKCTRADRVHALAQRIADAAADASGEPRREVPRLDNDLALPDQLRVLTADAAAAGVQDQELVSLVRETSAVLG